MLYILDTADLEAIRHCNEFYPLAGVTTNPSIIAKEKTDFWRLVGEIRAVIGGGNVHPGTGPHRRESGRIVRRTVRQPIG